MGASLAYTHFSDKAPSSEQKDPKKTNNDQPPPTTMTSTELRDPSSAQSHAQ